MELVEVAEWIEDIFPVVKTPATKVRINTRYTLKKNCKTYPEGHKIIMPAASNKYIIMSAFTLIKNRGIGRYFLRK